MDGATRLVEGFVDQNPNNLAARRELLAYYRHSQRTDDYFHNLELICSLEPTRNELIELTGLYNFYQQYDKQIATQRLLIERFPIVNVGDDDSVDPFQDLLDLLPHTRNVTNAIELIDLVADNRKELIDSNIALLSVRFALEKGDVEGARSRAESWLKRSPRPGDLAGFMNEFSDKGHHQLALTIMEPHFKWLDGSHILLDTWVQVMLSVERHEEVYADLTQRYQNKKLPATLLGDYVGLISDREDYIEAIGLVRTEGLEQFPVWQYVRFIEIGLAMNDLQFARFVSYSLPRKSEHALLLAELSWRLEDAHGLERWLTALKRRPPETLQERYRLARLYNIMNRRTEAVLTLKTLLKEDISDHQLLWTLTLFAMDLKREDLLWPVVDRVRQSETSPILDRAWAFSSVSRGYEDRVVQWFQANPAQEPAFMRDLYFHAADHGQHVLASGLAKAIYNQTGQEQDQINMLESLVAAGQYEQALDQLQSMAGRKSHFGDRYLYALEQAVSDGKADPDRLLVEIRTRLANKNLPGEERDDLLYMLINHDMDAEALPHIRQLAWSGHRDWGYAYQDILAAQGKKQDLARFWNRLFDISDSKKEKTQIAFRLLENGHRYLGEDAFFKLAKDEAPEDPSTRQLLYLWGPRPPAYGLDWLEQRAVAATGEERAGWLSHLDQRDRHDAVVRVLETETITQAHPSSLLYLKALAALFENGAEDNRKTLIDRLQTFTPQAKKPETLWIYGQLAEVVEAFPEAEEAYSRLLSYEIFQEEGPPKRIFGQALRQLAMFAFDQGRRAAALGYFNRLHERFDHDLELVDHETHFFAGELYSEKLVAERAENHYRRSLERLELEEHSRTLNHRERIIRAQIYHRLGRVQQAVRLYGELYKEKPYDKHLRADYVTMLMEVGETKRAHYILENAGSMK